jgi:hypothetical protein
MTKFPPMPPSNEEAKMKTCMQSHVYGENTGKGYTGEKISVCRECMAKFYCDRENWIILGGKP